jgi:hypothetical protein
MGRDRRLQLSDLGLQVTNFVFGDLGRGRSFASRSKMPAAASNSTFFR